VSRSSGRTKPCARADAQGRFRRAEAFLYVADLVLGEEVGGDDDGINLSGVSAALAVLAGIAAADAACCHRLAAHSRGQDHKQAVALVRTVVPNGPAMANDLDRLLDLKDNAHYGVLGVSHKEARSAVEQARRIVEAARAILATP
jgi:hypothetical protein